MVYREKVIEALEICIRNNDTGIAEIGCSHNGCKLMYDCCSGIQIMRDALALLKAQEPVEPILKHEGITKYDSYYVCPICDEDLTYEQCYCSECGRELNWEWLTGRRNNDA